MRKRSALPWAILILLVAGAGAVWWYRGHAVPTSGLDALAYAAPADAQLFVAVDLRERHAPPRRRVARP